VNNSSSVSLPTDVNRISGDRAWSGLSTASRWPLVTRSPTTRCTLCGANPSRRAADGTVLGPSDSTLNTCHRAAVCPPRAPGPHWSAATGPPAWHGWTTPENAIAYEDLLNGTIAPKIMARQIPGLRDLSVLHRVPAENPAHFLTLMTFDGWSAGEQFAGPDATASVVPPAARALLSRHDEHSQHFELRHH
jgi:hypothetical protein